MTYQSGMDTPPPKKNRTNTGLILGLASLGLMSLLCLAVVAYLLLRDDTPNSPVANPAAPPLTQPEPVRNRLAIADDAAIWSVAPDGSDRQLLSETDSGLQFPAWSPDGRWVSYFTLSEGTVGLYLVAAAAGQPTTLFEQEDATPFYQYWSPDSRAITFLAQEAGRLTLRLAPINGQAGRVLGEGAPLYWAWSPDASQLIMHVNGSRASSSEAHTSLLANQAEAERQPLDTPPGGFQAPLWSADSRYLYFVGLEGGEEALFRAEATDPAPQKLLDLGGFTQLTLSPDGQKLAYVQLNAQFQPPFGTAYLVDADGQNRTLLREPVGSLYWSPDGSKLAMLTQVLRQEGQTAQNGLLAAPLPQAFQFSWLIYDLASGTYTTLTSFEPTSDFMQTVPYFDQYGLSLRFWSPDSRYFVVTKAGAENNTVWVYDTSGAEGPVAIGQGNFAVWSWR